MAEFGLLYAIRYGQQDPFAEDDECYCEGSTDEPCGCCGQVGGCSHVD